MDTVSYLMDCGLPYVRYKTMTDLMGLAPGDFRVLDEKKKMLAYPPIVELMREVSEWPGKIVNSHRSPVLLYHKLEFLADIGITREDGGIAGIPEKVMEHQSEEGPFQVLMNISEHFGGTGEDTWAWALCDAPVLLYFLSKTGYAGDARAARGTGYLSGLVRENGWPCAVSKELGKFRGPGRKGDPCPYSSLIMLKLLAGTEGMEKSPEARTGVECLLDLWERSLEVHPYQFYMGNDFRKLKAPFIWYDILHTADTLSLFDFARGDRRFLQMLDMIELKADEKGLYTPESVWLAWKGWDFGQKKKPSPWLTFLVKRIEKRVFGAGAVFESI